VERLLALNGWQQDWPLQVGQKLVISPGNVTPSPTLNAIQKLTPDADGRYYHTIQSGETLLWIAGFYEVPLSDLMNWNGLDNTSVIYANQRLILLVMPPPTSTLTPAPATNTPSPQPTLMQLPPTVDLSEPVTESSATGSNAGVILGVIVIVIVAGGLVWWKFPRRS